jgi:CHAT domain-containing protein/Tfp pilus assembly protein PilF
MAGSLSPRPTQGKYRSLAVHCGLALFIGAPSIQVQTLRAGFSAGSAAAPQNGQQAQRLERGKPIERKLAGGKSHSYQLSLDAGQYAKLVIDQRGIDVVVQLLGLDGKQIMEFDSESRPQGQESVPLVAEAAWSHRLIVRSKQKEAPEGSYEIRVEELRAATADDRALQEASRLYEKHLELHNAGKYDEALPLVERALEIREKVLGAEHREVANAIHSAAILRWLKGDYAKAEPLFQRALMIREKSLGVEHPDVARSLNNLGILYKDMGEDAKAEQFYYRALDILVKSLGPEHLLAALPLVNLAILYSDRGEYAKAEPLYQRALTASEKAFGQEHPRVAMALNNLATLYRERGDFAKAKELHQRALDIRLKTLGPEHPSVATSLYNLGLLYTNADGYTKAEPLYQRALAIREKALGPDHPEVAKVLNNLAAILSYKGDYVKAESLYNRALVIKERSLGPDHPDFAVSLQSLAYIYYYKGEYAKAEPLLQRALDIKEKALGAGHLLIADSLIDLAALYEAKGDIAQAVTLLSRANAVIERDLALNLASGSERQKLAYLTLFSNGTDFTLSLHSRAAPDDPQALELAFTTLLRRKGRGLDAMADTIATSRRHASPQDQKLFDQLADARARLAALTFKPSGATTHDAYRAHLKLLGENVERLEAELSARGDRFRAQTQPVTLTAVQAALPAGGALVEFVVFTPQEPQAKRSGPPRYLAYLLSAQGQPRWVDLGEAAVIDRVVDAWRKALRDPNRMDVKKLARAVDDKVMRPLRPLLGETRRLLIAPDSLLNLIPFAALVDERNRYLIERYTISYLTSGRDLLRLPISRPSENAPMVVANPAFGRASTVVAQQKSADLPPGDQARTQGDQAQIYFQPLPSTGREALAIKAALPGASLLLREQATESAVKQAESPRILHIATHGFFFGDQEATPAETLGGFGDNQLRASDLRFVKWGAKVENPLLRSGLALAGANQGKSGDDDGLLTAMEVAGLDLRGTMLVVLSACDTGVGEVKNGEGVQGLRRALVLAGSESQVMSLWAVLDNTGKDLMTPYYEALRQGKGRSDGLRQAQLQMLRSEDRRHPFYWAAFIQSGEWANLDGQR